MSTTKQIRIYKERWKQLKLAAAEKEISIADLIEELLTNQQMYGQRVTEGSDDRRIMKKTAYKLLYEAKVARLDMLRGVISIDEARVIVKRYVDYFNKYSKKAAKKYNKSPQRITVAGLLRYLW